MACSALTNDFASDEEDSSSERASSTRVVAADPAPIPGPTPLPGPEPDPDPTPEPDPGEVPSPGEIPTAELRGEELPSAPKTKVAGPRTDPRLGEVVDAAYRIEERLARGGMSVVYRATRLDDGASVALKVMTRLSTAKESELCARFAREAAMLAKMENSHVLQIHGSGVLEDGAPYVVLELLEGHDVRRLLVEEGSLSVERAVDLLLEACEALAEAHALGIVHRDLKPENLFIANHAAGRTLKVIDFGIAKWAEGTGTSTKLTQPLCALGSPEYMSPEQMEASDDVDERTDLWSLGVLLYELSCGRTPYKGQHLAQLMRAIVLGAAPSIEANVPTAPPGIDAVLGRLLATDLTKRVATVQEAATLLAPFGTDRARSSLARVLLVPPVQRTEKKRKKTTSRIQLRRRPRLTQKVVILVAAIGGLAAGLAVTAEPAPRVAPMPSDSLPMSSVAPAYEPILVPRLGTGATVAGGPKAAAVAVAGPVLPAARVERDPSPESTTHPEATFTSVPATPQREVTPSHASATAPSQIASQRGLFDERF